MDRGSSETREAAGPEGERPSKAAGPVTGCLLGFLCVVYPVGTILVELSSGMCASELFNPIPTWIHLLLVLLVPLASLIALVAFEKGVRANRVGLLSALLGGSLAVSAAYSLVFLPLVPIAIIAIGIAGLGLLPLTPYFVFLGTGALILLLHRSASALGRPVWPGLLVGAAVVLAAVVALELPLVLTTHGVRQALSPDPEERAAATRFLRQFGDEATLHRMCREGSSGVPTLTAAFTSDELHGVSRTDLERIHYEVTGRDASEESGGGWLLLRPSRSSNWSWERELETDRDPDLGTSTIGPALDDVKLASSRLDGTVDGHAALAYLEWTFELENTGPRQREARGVLHLPEGGVVSKLSLWIDGEERDAAFGGRGQTSTAYQGVVQRNMDPVLVTTRGRDAVLLCCFPIVRGETMRVRVGMTLPLRVEGGAGEGTTLELGLPALGKVNFDVRSPCSLWLESRDSLVDPRAELLVERAPAGTWVLRGELAAPASADRPRTIRCTGPSPLPVAWAEDYVQPGRLFAQELVRESRAPPERIVVVIDGSRSMESQRKRCIELLEAIDPGLSVSVVLAAENGPVELEGRAGAIERLREHDFRFGIDNVPALSHACDLVQETPRSAILWLHGIQPVFVSSRIPLPQRIERRPEGPAIVSCSLVDGANVLVEELSELPASRFSTLQGDRALERFRELHRESEGFVRRIEPIEVAPEGAFHGSDHIARLWAANRIEELRFRQRGEAVRIAEAYRLVTPVSGAVVLESQSQYEAAGLDTDVPPGAVPTVPEPGYWVLLTVAVVALAWTGRRRPRGAPR